MSDRFFKPSQIIAVDRLPETIEGHPFPVEVGMYSPIKARRDIQPDTQFSYRSLDILKYSPESLLRDHCGDSRPDYIIIRNPRLYNKDYSDPTKILLESVVENICLWYEYARVNNAGVLISFQSSVEEEIMFKAISRLSSEKNFPVPKRGVCEKGPPLHYSYFSTYPDHFYLYMDKRNN